jgi:hypothetical protein
MDRVQKHDSSNLCVDLCSCRSSGVFAVCVLSNELWRALHVGYWLFCACFIVIAQSWHICLFVNFFLGIYKNIKQANQWNLWPNFLNIFTVIEYIIVMLAIFVSS